MIGLYIIIGFIILFFIIAFIIIYNNLVKLKNNISKAWANIDVLLKQRFDELSKLIDTVKGYMKYEKKVLTDITKARSMYDNAKGIKDMADFDDFAKKSTNNLFAVAENYPDLKASKNFLKLQSRITELENMIADRREFFNDTVTIYNTRIKQIPYNTIAGILGYKRKELFVASGEEKKVVDFDK